MTLIRIPLVIALFCSLALVGCAWDRRVGMEAIGYFSTDYEEARKKFLEAALSAGATTENFKNPNPGPKGQPLYTDVALIGPSDATSIIVLGSGTHGVDGLAGSAIQTGLLKEGIASRLKPNMSIVFIHDIDPYGFAHLRRFNEDNVDLNRNFLDHSKPYPRNPGYEQLADAIDPPSLSLWANALACSRILWYGLRIGPKKAKEAVSQGQYTNPRGLFLGGQTETWSNKTLHRIADLYLSKAACVVLVDFHTGLGPYGSAEVILNEKGESAAYKRSVECWGDRVKTTASGTPVSVHLQGTAKLAFPRFLPDAEITAVSLEFGTVSPMRVFWALRAENWLHHNGDRGHPDAEAIKDRLLRAFYPNRDEWKARIWEQGREVIEQAMGCQ